MYTIFRIFHFLVFVIFLNVIYKYTTWHEFFVFFYFFVFSDFTSSVWLRQTDSAYETRFTCLWVPLRGTHALVSCALVFRFFRFSRFSKLHKFFNIIKQLYKIHLTSFFIRYSNIIDSRLLNGNANILIN